MDAAAKHRIPVIDRMMDILGRLQEDGVDTTIRGLATHLDVPRTTVYRILNTLQQHRMVVRADQGRYRLGPRLLSLASRATAGEGYDLTALALPHLRRLSVETGEASKISVVEGDRILVVAAVPGNRAFGLTVFAGEYLPLAAGAAGKMLLAQRPEGERAAILDRLSRQGGQAPAELRRLAGELLQVRQRGWAEDRGEYAPSVCAFAAPVVSRSGDTVAAISIPFLAGASPERVAALRAAVIAAAAAVSDAVPTDAAPTAAPADEAD